MNIFEIRNGKLAVTEVTLTVASFRKIWEADKSVKKGSAMDQFALIYHMHHPRSPYATYPDVERESAVRNNELANTVRISEKYKQAESDFIRFRDEADPSFSLYSAAKEGLYKLRDYFKSVDPLSEDFEVKELTDSLKKVAEIVKSFKILEDQIKTQEFTQTKTKGNRKINQFEQ